MGNWVTVATKTTAPTSAPLAPDATSATCAAVYGLWANITTFALAGLITVPDGAASWAHAKTISVLAYGTSAPSGLEIAHLVAPFTIVSHQIAYSGGNFPQPLSGTQFWSIVIKVLNEFDTPAPSPVTVSGIPVVSASVQSVAISESARAQDQNQGVLVRLNTTITLTGGQVPQNVTLWLSRDGGTTKLLQGWQKITTSPQTIVMPVVPSSAPQGYYVPTNGAESWIMYAASGPLSDLTPPATAVASLTLAVPQIGFPSANGVTGATNTAATAYTDGLGLPDWEIQTVSWTDPDVTHPANGNYDINAWYTCLTFQCTDSVGNPAPGAAAGANLDQGGDEVEVARFPVLGGRLQSTSNISGYGYNPPGSIYTYACLRVYTVNRLAANGFKDTSGNAVRQNCWGVQPRTLVNFGSVPNAGALPASPFAPNLTAVSAVTVNFLTEGQLPKWNFNGTVSLPSPFTAIKRIHITIPGLPEVLAIPSALFGSSQFPLVGQVMSYTTPNFPRDTVTFNYTASFWVENADGILTSAPPTAAVSVTGTAAPFASSAPPAPVITTATASVTYQRDGHDYKAAFPVQFTAPSNPAGGAYSVRISRINQALQRSTIDTLPGPFTVGQNYGFTSNAVDPIPASSQNWTIEFLPINADNVAQSPKTVSVTVAPNVVSSVTASEGTAFVEPGGGSKTRINPIINISSTNAPGLSTAVPQTVTVYFSADGGSTWFGLEWYDMPTSGAIPPIEVWRPTDSSKSCKVAVAIGAWNYPPNTFQTGFTTGPIANSALPASAQLAASQSFVFTLSVVGAPSATGCTGAQVLARTASGAALYNGVTIGITGDKVVSFGVQPGMQVTNPLWATDPNFFFSRFECYVVQAGTPAPGFGEVIATGDQGGTKTYHNGPLESLQGAINLASDIDGWEFNPVGSTFTVLRVRVIAYSRSGQSTVQNCWSGSPPNTGIVYNGTYCDITFGPPPATSITSTLSASSLGSGMYLDAAGKVQLVGPTLVTNGSFEADAPITFPAGVGPTGWAVGGSQSGTIAIAANPAPSTVNNSARSVALTGTHSSVVQTFACNPGDGFNLTDYVFASAANGTMRLVLLWLNSGQGFVGSVEAAQVFATGAWTKMSIAGTVPIGAVFVQIFVGTNGNNNGGVWYADNVDLQPTGKVSAGNGLGFDSSGNLIVSANSEFKFVSGQLQINGVDFTKGFNGFAVGSAAVPQITIAPNGVLLGWIGFDATSGLSGAWFKRVLIGGANPANAQIFADANGNVTVNGSIIAGVLVSATLSVLNIVGWNGAAISIQSGVNFVGTNFTVRVNIPSFGSLGALALSANGGLVLSTDGSTPQVQLSPSATGPSVAVVTGSVTVQMFAGNGGQVTITNGANSMQMTATNIKRNGVIIL